MKKKIVTNNYFSTNKKIRIASLIFVFIFVTGIFTSAFTSPKQKSNIKKNKNITETANQKNESRNLFYKVLGIILFRKNIDDNKIDQTKDSENIDIKEQDKISLEELKGNLIKTEKRIKRLARQKYNLEKKVSKKIAINLKTNQLNKTLQRLYKKKILIAEQISDLEKNQDLYATKTKSINPVIKKSGDNVKSLKPGKVLSDNFSNREEAILKNNNDSVKHVSTVTFIKEDNLSNKHTHETVNEHGYRVVAIDDLLVDTFENKNAVLDQSNDLKVIEQDLAIEKEETFNQYKNTAEITDSNFIDEYGVNVWNTKYENRNISDTSNKTKNYIHKMITNGKIDEIRKMAFENNDVRKVIREFILTNLKKEYLSLGEKDTVNEYIFTLGETGTDEDIEFLRYINNINGNPNDYYVHNISMSIWKLKKRFRDNSIESEDDFNDAADYINYIYHYYKLNPNENMKLYNFEIEFLSEIADSLSKSKYKHEAISVIEKLTHFQNEDFTNYINKIITSIGNELDREHIDKSNTLIDM